MVAATCITTTSLLAGPANVAPMASAHGMHMGQQAPEAEPGTAAAKYRCQPLTKQQRLDAFDLGGFSHRISTTSPEAQRLFDQGLLLAYSYNQPEAMNAFKAGLEYDPDAAMLYWGMAYASAPYQNKGAVPNSDESPYLVFSQEDLQRGRQALDTARKLLQKQEQQQQQQQSASSPSSNQSVWARDKVYIEALTKAYATDATYGPDWEAAEIAYGQAMQEVAARFPDDPDAPALAADAYANLTPLDFYDRSVNQPRLRTPLILALLEESLSRSAAHPLGNHLMVHVTEGAKPGRGPNTAGRGEGAAQQLSVSYPSFSHLTHMPSHNFIRVGRWHEAVEANKRALEADVTDAKRCLYPYMPVHETGMLLYAAVSGGEMGVAEEYARRLEAYPEVFGPGYETDGKGRLMRPLIWTHFARWDNILALTLQDLDVSLDGISIPKGTEQFSRAIFHYVRAMALAAKAAAACAGSADGSVPADARQRVVDEIAQLRSEVEAMPPDPVTRPGQGLGVWSSGFKAFSAEVLEEAQARLAVLDRDWAAAEAHLVKATEIEPVTGYTEPPRQLQPADQLLAWVQLQRPGGAARAVATYEKDLSEYPSNPWSLIGLRDTLRAVIAEKETQVASAQTAVGKASVLTAALPSAAVDPPAQVGEGPHQVAPPVDSMISVLGGPQGKVGRAGEVPHSQGQVGPAPDSAATSTNEGDNAMMEVNEVAELRTRLNDVEQQLAQALQFVDPSFHLTSSAPSFSNF